jgi:uncharacterized membrane protein YesL
VTSPENDVPTPGQHTYVRMTLVSLWENLPLVLLSGAVFSLLCVPASLLFLLGLFAPALVVGALTIAPACTALLAQENEIVRDLKTNIGTMFRALPRFWTRSVGLGLLICFPLLAALLTLPMLSLSQVSLVVWLGLGADALGLLILVALYLYAFPLLVLHDLDLARVLRNALILASRHTWNTLGLLGMGILFALASAYVSPALLFILPAVWGSFIMNNCRMVVAEELVDG